MTEEREAPTAASRRVRGRAGAARRRRTDVHRDRLRLRAASSSPNSACTSDLDWNGGLELISAIPGSTAEVAAFVNEFVDRHGDGVYTVVLRVPGASAAEAVAERYGSTTRFRQSFSGEGTYLDEIDLSVFGLPLTFLSTNIP